MKSPLRIVAEGAFWRKLRTEELPGDGIRADGFLSAAAHEKDSESFSQEKGK